jgi:hypothetical protein
VSHTSALGNLPCSNTPLVFTPQDTRPARHILHLNFNQFRTIGMRRSVGEGVHSRFVTGERLELALKVCMRHAISGLRLTDIPLGRKCRTS